MKRPVSASCLVRNSPTKAQSVTILSNVDLPKYSSERFYLLSEIEIHGAPTCFLSDQNDTSTQATAEDDTVEEQVLEETRQFPKFMVLYLHWRPDDTQSPDAFCETILGAVNAIRETADLTSSASEEGRASSTGNLNEMTGSKLPSSLYICVDKLGTDSTTVEQLARTVASHQVLRKYTQGITVGIADHPRAAPALEATVEAILVGSRDRRGFNHQTSCLGVVTPHADHLLGLQDPTVTDAAQGVQQKLVVAEWNGRGNLPTYASRAHQYWRLQNNLPAEDTVAGKRKLPRRIIRPQKLPNDETLFDVVAVCFILFYFAFHFGREFVDYLMQTAPSLF